MHRRHLRAGQRPRNATRTGSRGKAGDRGARDGVAESPIPRIGPGEDRHFDAAVIMDPLDPPVSDHSRSSKTLAGSDPMFPKSPCLLVCRPLINHLRFQNGGQSDLLEWLLRSLKRPRPAA